MHSRNAHTWSHLLFSILIIWIFHHHAHCVFLHIFLIISCDILHIDLAGSSRIRLRDTNHLSTFFHLFQCHIHTISGCIQVFLHFTLRINHIGRAILIYPAIHIGHCLSVQEKRIQKLCIHRQLLILIFPPIEMVILRLSLPEYS